MHFEQLEVFIDLVHRPKPLNQGVHCSQGSAAHGTRSFGYLVVQVASFEHRLGLVAIVLFLQPSLELFLALAEDFAV